MQDLVGEDRREIGATYAFAPPRIYENLLTTTMVRMEDAGAIKRTLFHTFIGIARQWGEKILNGEKVPLYARLLYLGKSGNGAFQLAFQRTMIIDLFCKIAGPEVRLIKKLESDTSATRDARRRQLRPLSAHP